MEPRVIVITGAAAGLGAATARALLSQGDRVVVTARSQAKAEAACGALSGESRAAIPMALDVADDASVETFAQRLHADLGRVDVLINNAGAIFEEQSADLASTLPSTLVQALDNNAVSAYRTARAFLPGMNERGYGRIVNVSSGMGALSEMGGGHPAYRASKAALNAITRICHAEARGDVKVNSVCPGWVRTDMGGESATRDLAEGIFGIVWAANLTADGPSGGFFRDGKPISW